MMLRNDINALRRLGLENFLSVLVLIKKSSFYRKAQIMKENQAFSLKSILSCFKLQEKEDWRKKKEKNKEVTRCTSLSGGNQVDGSPPVCSVQVIIKENQAFSVGRAFQSVSRSRMQKKEKNKRISLLHESFWRKPGWRFTASLQYSTCWGSKPGNHSTPPQLASPTSTETHSLLDSVSFQSPRTLSY